MRSRGLVCRRSFDSPPAQPDPLALDAGLRAHAHEGRLVLDEPTALPEGELVPLGNAEASSATACGVQMR